MGWTWALLGLVVIFTYKADTAILEKKFKFSTGLSVGALLGALSANILSKNWRMAAMALCCEINIVAFSMSESDDFFYYIHCIVVVWGEVLKKDGILHNKGWGRVV